MNRFIMLTNRESCYSPCKQVDTLHLISEKKILKNIIKNALEVVE